MSIVQRRILLATDLSARCDRAFDRAVLLARDWSARLTIATALEGRADELMGHQSPPSWRRSDSEMADAEEQIGRDLDGENLTADVVVRRGKAAEVIATAARETAYDLIITGIARSTGFSRTILGATIEALLRARLGPVLVVKRRARHAYRTALVGTDFSDGARAALRSASALFPEASLTVLHAYRPAFDGLASTKESEDAAYRQAIESCARFVAQAIPTVDHDIEYVAEAGFPETLLNQFAFDRKIDLIAAGTHGRHLVLDLLFGSTCGALMLSSPCDLLLVADPGTGSMRE